MTTIFDAELFHRTLFFPRADVTPPPAGARDSFVDVTGARLHLRWHRAPGARVTVLFFHGNGEVVADYDDAAARFAACGAELAVVDYRGYGASTGSPTLRSLIDDAHPALDALLCEATLPVVVMGRSIGSACAAELYPRGDVAGVVIESGFTDLCGVVRRRGLEPPARFSDEERAVFDPLPKLARGALPLLVLHGADDTLIPAAEGRAAHDAAGAQQKTLVVVEGHGHNDISLAPRYWASLAAFVGDVTRA